MKLLLLLALAISSAFAQVGQIGLNQSYVLMDNGKALTVRSYFPDDNIVKMFRIDDYFFDFNNIKVKKSNYIIDEDDNIYAVTSQGYMLKYDHFEADSKIKTFGETFFISRKGTIYVIDYNGNIITNEMEDKLNVKMVGANYLITKDNVVIMINSLDGKIYPTSTKIDVESVKINSNNFLTTKTGHIYTFGFLTNADGSYKEIVSKIKTNVVFKISKVGGNFFFDNDKNIHTISFNGLYDLGMANRQFQVAVSMDSVDRSNTSVKHIGSNYFIYGDGAVYFVDRFGSYYHLTNTNMRVGLTSR